MNGGPPEPEVDAAESGDEASEAEPLEVRITAAQHGERLDKILADVLSDLSRSALQRWIEHGRVTMDGEPVTRRSRARGGALLRVRPEPPPAYDAVAEDLPLVVLYEDAHLLVVDKAAGMVVHPAPGHRGGTLVNALLHHVELSAGDPVRPGIVHRLDKDTSGVMVVAKSALAHERLVRTFGAHDLERRYVAIALGAVESRTYDTFHHRHPTDRKRFTTRVAYGRRAVTHVEPLEALPGATHVACTLETGRTHQIRVHLAEHGHPLLGDPVYGGSVSDPTLRAIGQRLGRQALHAAVLGFAHPIEGTPLRFESPPPADFDSALAQLRAPPP